MNADVVRASVRTVPCRAVSLHLTAAAVLVATTWRGLDDDGTTVLVLRGVAVLLAAALALAVDEPAAQLLDATPTPLGQRLLVRAGLSCAVLVPAWLLAIGAATRAGADVPVWTLSLELAALTAVGLAVPASLRRWGQVSEPGLVTGPVLLGGLLAAAHLPRRLTLLPGSPVDPVWDTAHSRWAVVLVVAAALLVRAVADPATARVAGLRPMSPTTPGAPVRP